MESTEGLRKITTSFSEKSVTEIRKNLITKSMKILTLNKPAYFGMCILNLGKTFDL